MYQEQYTVQEITGYTGSWPSNRRCGYAFVVFDDGDYTIGTTDGGHQLCTTGSYTRCPNMTRPSPTSIGIDAVCSHSSSGTWHNYATCPKGWGRNKLRYPSDVYSVDCAQGYVKNGTPVYSTVTKYRDTVYNYTAGRIAKA